MLTEQDTATRSRDRTVTALKSKIHEHMSDAVRQLRTSDEKIQERVFLNLGPMGVRVVVGIERDTFDAARTQTVNEAMADAVERAMNLSLGMVDQHLMGNGMFIAGFSVKGDPVRVSVVAEVRP